MFGFAIPALSDEVSTVLRIEDRLEVGEKLVIGEAKMASMEAYGLHWRARIDSGVTTTSIPALDIEEFERDGQDWVRFTARNEELDANVEIELPVSRVAFIQKRNTDETQRRPARAFARSRWQPPPPLCGG